MKRLKMAVLTAGLLLALDSCAVPETVIGVRDGRLGERIERLNATRNAYDRHDYAAAERLVTDELEHADSSFARQRLLNELADLYSFHILDLERAIEVDTRIQEIGSPSPATGYAFTVNAADNRILVDPVYRDRYVNAPSDRILSASRRRLERNRLLVRGEAPGPSEAYSRQDLEQRRTNVAEDFQRTHPGTADRKRIISRLIRIEYELYRATGSRAAIRDGHRLALAEGMARNDFYLEEIDFLSLSDYFTLGFAAGGPITLAERSLEITYLPYSRLRDERSRLRYNTRVNGYIETLIDAHHRAGRHADALYYASLNKSRMILEDRVARTRSAIADVARPALAIDARSGLPDSSAFLAKLQEVDDLVDFYASADDRLIVTEVRRGTVTARRLDQGTVARIRAALDSERQRIAAGGRAAPNRGLETVGVTDSSSAAAVPVLASAPAPTVAVAIRQLAAIEPGRSPVLAPDKWLAPYPLGYLLGVPEHRALSVLDYGNRPQLRGTGFVGYFDPLGDLAEARNETGPISTALRGARTFVGAEATLAALRQPLQRNILHLSMHGVYEGQDPTGSYLRFSSGTAGGEERLFARDMDRYDQLKDNDLVFTAACETGQFGSDRQNQSEIVGILRPLLINNNRNVILTLWSVDSRSAGEFVALFYQRLGESGNVVDAFDRAQDQLRRRYPDRPYHWSPYYLIQNG